MPDVITFQQALERANGTRHVLLGNGFSRACRDNIFSYGALFDQADFEGLSPAARNAFGALQTTDFEVVIRALKQAALLAAVYLEDNPQLAANSLSSCKKLMSYSIRKIPHPCGIISSVFL